MPVIEYTRWEDVPEHLKTKTQLGKMGLRPGKDQKPVGVKTSRDRKTPERDLFEVSGAVSKRQVSEKQAAALQKAQAASLERRTCRGCGWVEELGRHYRRKVYVRDGYCSGCREEMRLQEQIVNDEREAIQWARDVLNMDGVVFLDTETTGLGGEVIELAIVGREGQVLFNSRFRPQLEIEPDAAAVHGLTAEMLAGEPDWSERYEEIKATLTGAQKVLIFNAGFDVGRIWYTCRLRDLEGFEFKNECVMEWYSQFCGVWSRRHGSYTWQGLPGGDHRALGDCLAALDVVKGMAGEALSQGEALTPALSQGERGKERPRVE